MTHALQDDVLAKNTPGPWEVGNLDPAIRESCIFSMAQPSQIIARVCTIPIGCKGSRDANARLIAAAPAMAAILRELAYGQTSGSRMNAIMAESRAILTQAE